MRVAFHMFSHVLIRAELEARPIWDDVIIAAYELRSFIWAVFLKGNKMKRNIFPLKNNVKLVSIVTFRNRRGSGPDFAEIVRMGCRSPWFHRFLQRKGS